MTELIYLTHCFLLQQASLCSLKCFFSFYTFKKGPPDVIPVAEILFRLFLQAHQEEVSLPTSTPASSHLLFSSAEILSISRSSEPFTSLLRRSLPCTTPRQIVFIIAGANILGSLPFHKAYPHQSQLLM